MDWFISHYLSVNSLFVSLFMHVNLLGLVLKDVTYTYMFLSDHLKSAFMCIIMLKFAYLLNVELGYETMVYKNYMYVWLLYCLLSKHIYIVFKGFL